jgi:N-acetylglucosamine repressor
LIVYLPSIDGAPDPIHPFLRFSSMLAATAKANQALTKRHNTRLVLKTIYDHEPISRADVARITNLTATTVSHAIADLMAGGLVQEIGPITIERGKPPMLLGMHKDARHVIALNLAQRTFHGGVFNLRGEIVSEHQIAAEKLHGADALSAVYDLIDTLLPQSHQPLLGIGVGAPGIIDIEQGVICRAVNLDWYDLPLAGLLNDRYDLPIYVVNDNQASLLGVHLFGAHGNHAGLVVIRVGRGIGAGVMVHGQFVRSFGAGEIGHIAVIENGKRCTCGNIGCLETVASSRSIVQQARQLLATHPESHLGRLAAGGAEIDISAVTQAYHAGDRFLQTLVDEAGQALGVVIAHLVSILAPPQILLCGSVTGFGAPLLQRITNVVQQRSLTAQLQPPQIDFVSLESDIIMLGAATLLLKNELGLF